MPARWGWVVVALPIAVLLTACGDDGGGTPEPTSSSEMSLAPAGLLSGPVLGSFEHPTPPPQGTLAALGGEIDFDHPDGEVTWEGPDERVRSIGEYHCGALPDLKEAFDLPDVITVRYGEVAGSFFSPSVVRFDAKWLWTGYNHDDWQLWRDDDPSVLYVVHTSRPDVAFEYHALGCD